MPTRGGSGARRPSAEERPTPGREGGSRTVEVSAAALRGTVLRYAPEHDGAPDPGEVVWTWVPYEENDGRGKDRPVLVVAQVTAEEALAVQMTSHGRDDRDYVAVGAGAWDAEGRPSWVRIDRVFRVHTSGLRREAAALPRAAYDDVAAALRTRFGMR